MGRLEKQLCGTPNNWGDTMALPKFTWKANRAYQDGIVFTTLISQFESGKEQRRSKGLPRRKFRLYFQKENITKQEATEIWNFFVARKGRYEAFEWDYEKDDGTVETIKVRFDTDVLERDVFMNLLYEFGLPLIEVI